MALVAVLASMFACVSKSKVLSMVVPDILSRKRVFGQVNVSKQSAVLRDQP